MTRAVAHAALAAVITLAACGGDDGPGPDPGQLDWRECDSTAEGFVRDATLALLGRRPTSQHEVDAFAALYRAAEDAVAADPTAPPPRAVVARALLAGPERGPRWTAHVMDALRVARVDDQSLAGCWGEARRTTIDPALAEFVRDNPAGSTAPAAFSMLDLAQSAIALDDLTPIYRAHLFALVGQPLIAANVPPLEAELARRADVGATFDATYLNRDLVCLGCHNSEASVTDADDPGLDRHWPLPGLVDRALFGNSFGIGEPVAHAPFRVDGFVIETGRWQPWGMTRACGDFADPATVGPDPAGIAGHLGSLTGDRLTVRDLEAALARGFAALRAGGLTIAADGTIADPDAALAYMVATSIVESAWREIIGTPLTIANYFPRNQAARDLLQELTDGFVASGFSLDHLLVAIVSTDYFSRLPPSAGCSVGPYPYPAVYDPWVIADPDPARHGNGPGDAVTPVSARTLLSAAYAALGWPAPATEAFPVDEEACAPLACGDLQSYCNFADACCVTYEAVCRGTVDPAVLDEMPFQRAIGAFLKLGERGFRGLDFQARLAWEDRFGTCRKPTRVTVDDFVDRAVAAGQAAPGATVADVVLVLKDRLVGEASIEPTAEAPALAAVLGSALDAPAAASTVDGAAPAVRRAGVVAAVRAAGPGRRRRPGPDAGSRRRHLRQRVRAHRRRAAAGLGGHLRRRRADRDPGAVAAPPPGWTSPAPPTR
ncbi:MAG: hypothetical protein IPL61_40420 [Myxococcales bacterium]|nr:hypothetical protein [Myxococcales bacterium]